MLDIACMLCSVGAVMCVFVLAALVLFLAQPEGPRDWMFFLYVGLAAISAGSCAAEDRVCDLAEARRH